MNRSGFWLRGRSHCGTIHAEFAGPWPFWSPNETHLTLETIDISLTVMYNKFVVIDFWEIVSDFLQPVARFAAPGSQTFLQPVTHSAASESLIPCSRSRILRPQNY